MPLPAPAAWQRLLLLAVLLGLGGLHWRIGAFDDFRDMNRVRTLLDAWAPWADVLFVATFAVLRSLGILAIFWSLPAALIWPFPVEFALSMTGDVCAASVGFFLARYLARDWVAARLPERMWRHDEKIAADSLARGRAGTACRPFAIVVPSPLFAVAIARPVMARASIRRIRNHAGIGTGLADDAVATDQ